MKLKGSYQVQLERRSRRQSWRRATILNLKIYFRAGECGRRARSMELSDEPATLHGHSKKRELVQFNRWAVIRSAGGSGGAYSRASEGWIDARKHCKAGWWMRMWLE